MKRERVYLRGMLAAIMLLALAPGTGANVDSPLLIDDFARGDGRSALGTPWRCFTDQVMGGVSTADHAFKGGEGAAHVRLTGQVSTENNGGFIQVAVDLEEGGKALDATGYRGVRLHVRGNGERYSVHLRSKQCWLPWQYFAASFPTSDTWTTVELPFDRFEAHSIARDLNRGRLTRLGLVAIGKEMTADLSVARVEFYR